MEAGGGSDTGNRGLLGKAVTKQLGSSKEDTRRRRRMKVSQVKYEKLVSTGQFGRHFDTFRRKLGI